jgi:hypothetical protein
MECHGISSHQRQRHKRRRDSAILS